CLSYRCISAPHGHPKCLRRNRYIVGFSRFQYSVFMREEILPEYETTVPAVKRFFGQPIRILDRIGNGRHAASPSEIHSEVGTEILVGERILKASHPYWIVIGYPDRFTGSSKGQTV